MPRPIWNVNSHIWVMIKLLEIDPLSRILLQFCLRSQRVVSWISYVALTMYIFTTKNLIGLKLLSWSS